MKRAMATKQVEAALKGDHRTFLGIAKLLDQTAHARDRAPAPVDVSNAADEAIIASFPARRLAPPDGEEGS